MFLQNIKNNLNLNNKEKIKFYYNNNNIINKYNFPINYHNKYYDKVIINNNFLFKKPIFILIYEKLIKILNEISHFTHWH